MPGEVIWSVGRAALCTCLQDPWETYYSRLVNAFGPFSSSSAPPPYVPPFYAIQEVVS
jgi:hypothetical protein